MESSEYSIADWTEAFVQRLMQFGLSRLEAEKTLDAGGYLADGDTLGAGDPVEAANAELSEMADDEGDGADWP